MTRTDFKDNIIHLLSEVWLSFGALGITPIKTKAVCQRLPAHRPKLPLSHLQNVSDDKQYIYIYILKNAIICTFSATMFC